MSAGLRRRGQSFSRWTNILPAGHTAAAIDAYWCVAGHSHAPMKARLIAVVVNCRMLRGAVIPNRDITDRPSPTHCILDPGHGSSG